MDYINCYIIIIIWIVFIYLFSVLLMLSFEK